MAPNLPKRKLISNEKHKPSIEKINILKKTSSTVKVHLAKPLASSSKLSDTHDASGMCEDKPITKPTVLYLSPVDKVDEHDPNTLLNLESCVTAGKKKSSKSTNKNLKNQTKLSDEYDAFSSVQLNNSTYETAIESKTTDHNRMSDIAGAFDKGTAKVQDSSDSLKATKAISHSRKMKPNGKEILGKIMPRKLRRRKTTAVTCCNITNSVRNRNCITGPGTRRVIKKIVSSAVSVKQDKNILKLKYVNKNKLIASNSKSVASQKIKMNQGSKSFSAKKIEVSHTTEHDFKQQKIRQQSRCQTCNSAKSVKNRQMSCMKCNSSCKKNSNLQSKQLLKITSASRAEDKISSSNKCTALNKDNNLKEESVKIYMKANKSFSSPKIRKNLNMCDIPSGLKGSNLSVNESVGIRNAKKKNVGKIPSKTKTVGSQHVFETDANIRNKNNCYKISTKSPTSALPEISKNWKNKNIVQFVPKKLKISKCKIPSAKKCPSKVNIIKKNIPKAKCRLQSKIIKQAVGVKVKKPSLKFSELRKKAHKLSPVVSSEVKDSSGVFINQCHSTTRKRKLDSIKDQCEKNPTESNTNKRLCLKPKKQVFSNQDNNRELKEENSGDAISKKSSDVQESFYESNPFHNSHVKSTENSNSESPVSNVETSESTDVIKFMRQNNSVEKYNNDCETVPSEAEKMLGVRGEEIITFTCNVCHGKFSSTYIAYVLHLHNHYDQGSDKKYTSDSSKCESDCINFSVWKPQIESVFSLASQSGINANMPAFDNLAIFSNLSSSMIPKKQLITMSADFQQLGIEKHPISESCFSFICDKDFKIKFDENLIFNKRFSCPSAIQSDCYAYALEEKGRLEESTVQKPSSKTCCSSQSEVIPKDEQVEGIIGDHKTLHNVDDHNISSVSQHEKIHPEANSCNSTISTNKEMQIDIKNDVCCEILRNVDNEHSVIPVLECEKIWDHTSSCNPIDSTNKEMQNEKKDVEGKICGSETLHDVDNDHNILLVSEHEEIAETKSCNPVDNANKEVQINNKGDYALNESSSGKEEIPGISCLIPKQMITCSVYDSGKSNNEPIIKELSSNSDNDHNMLSSELKKLLPPPITSTTEVFPDVRDMVVDINKESSNVKEGISTTSCLISESIETAIVPYSHELNEGSFPLETNCISETENTKIITSETMSTGNTKLPITDSSVSVENDVELPAVTPSCAIKWHAVIPVITPMKPRGTRLPPLSAMKVVSSDDVYRLVINDLILKSEHDVALIHLYAWVDSTNVPTRLICAKCHCQLDETCAVSHFSTNHNIVTNGVINTCFLPPITKK